MPALLAFDTSGEHVHVGVSVGEAAWVVEDAGASQASANLLPCVRRVLGRAGIGLHELDAIAFGCGPGAFTGLRAACSAAQGLAWGARLPVLPIDTLMAVAEDARTRVGADDGRFGRHRCRQRQCQVGCRRQCSPRIFGHSCPACAAR